MRRWSLFIVIGMLLVPGCSDKSPPTAAGPNNGPALGNPRGEQNRADGGSESATGQPSDSGKLLTVDAIEMTTPAVWQRRPPGSSFVAAEFALPRADGDDADARLTVSTAGGGVQANVDRWKAQFDPLTTDEPLQTIDVGGLGVTVVDLSGDFNDARGPFASPDRRPEYRMIAAIVPVDGQLHFIKATGPQKTMANHAAAIDEMIRSIRPAR